VRVESPGLGLGSIFTVTLPIRAVRAPPRLENLSALVSSAMPTPSLASASLEGLRILIVDDEADARRLISRSLSDLGATVDSAASVDQAIELLGTMPPHILVSDLSMPGKDGFDLISRIRRKHKATDLPAIALTAFAHKEDRRRSLLAGFQMHVTKPVDLAELSAVIASLAGRTG
jgi:CheY-like chemotaxis protein